MLKILKAVTALIFILSFGSPLMAVEVKWGGEMRIRYTQTDNADFNDEVHDTNSKVTQRTRINVDFTLDEQTNAFVSIQDNRIWGEEASTLHTTREDHKQTDISEAWLKIKNVLPSLNMKVGRQFLLYGNKRLVAYSEWNEWARRFDGIKFFYESDKLNLDVFFTKVKDDYATTKVENDEHFNGIYGSYKFAPSLNMDLFVLQKDGDAKTGADDQNFLTLGTYLRGKIAAFDWGSEYARQMGKYNSDVDMDSQYYAFNAGYTIKDLSNLRIGGEYVVASGDDSGTSDKHEGFDSLFPGNHMHYGINDTKIQGIGEMQKLNNLKSISCNLSLKPTKKLKLKMEYWDFQKEQTADDDEAYGSEVNLQVWYKLTKSVSFHMFHAMYTPKDKTGDDPFHKTVAQLFTRF